QPRRQRSAGSGPKKKLGRPLSGRQTVIPQFNYAFYVWSSYGLFAAVMAWQFFQPLVQRRKIMAELREQEALKSGGYHDTGA
ncbi:MAG TPA: heme exporter protein CcmD, partial [Wenzhouxiangella sp.]|nr:heme exporter protein CcmD [Wenzhouxiangella sp.]